MKAYKEYFGGYKVDPNKILDKTFGDVDGYDDMVIQKIFQYKVTASIIWLQLLEKLMLPIFLKKE